MLKKLTGLFYGWRMVAAASALRVLGAGLHSFGFTVFFLPLSQDLNLNRTSTSLAFSLARAEGAIEGPIVGHLLDRYGPKPIMLAAVLLMGVGYLLLLPGPQLRNFFNRLSRRHLARPRRRIHACADGVDQHLVYPPSRPRHHHQQRGVRTWAGFSSRRS